MHVLRVCDGVCVVERPTDVTLGLIRVAVVPDCNDTIVVGVDQPARRGMSVAAFLMHPAREPTITTTIIAFMSLFTDSTAPNNGTRRLTFPRLFQRHQPLH